MALSAMGQSYGDCKWKELTNNETGPAATIRFLRTHYVGDEVVSLEAQADAQALENGNSTSILPVIKLDDKVYRAHDEHHFASADAFSVVPVREPGTFFIDAKSGNIKAAARWLKLWACPIP